MVGCVILKRGRDKSVRHGHPWVFSGAVEQWKGGGEDGVVAVLADGGAWLGWGLGVPGASLAVRLYSRDRGDVLGAEFFRRRLDRALALRERCFSGRKDGTNACRLVYAEADGVSGFIADRYADVLSIQVSAKALVPFLADMVGFLKERTGCRRVCIVPTPDAADREGLDAEQLRPLGTDAAVSTEIVENGFRFRVHCGAGQKTGYFLDQRENRMRVAAWAGGRSVLSAYCYTGGFDVPAAAAGATSILGLDRSEAALEMARDNLRLNGSACPAEYRRADVPSAMRAMVKEHRRFGLIVLDPPRLVAASSQKEKGMRAYKDVNRLAMALLEPGGILASFSCSGLVSAADLKMAIGWAAVDTGRDVRIVETLGQPADHPVLAVFPESEYLKGVIAFVD
jgi:23S rRNA (cytosine1962-C5)-methyltransferase